MNHIKGFFCVIGFLGLYIVGMLFGGIGEAFGSVGHWFKEKANRLAEIGQKDF